MADSLGRARAGDRLAFASLIRAHQRLVYSLASRMLSDRHEAEDLAQEVFMQLHRRLAGIESDAHLLFWLRKVTTNLAIDRLRQERKHPLESLDDNVDIADEPLERDLLLQRRLRALIARLPAAPRAVVLLRFQEDMDRDRASRAHHREHRRVHRPAEASSAPGPLRRARSAAGGTAAAGPVTAPR